MRSIVKKKRNNLTGNHFASVRQILRSHFKDQRKEDVRSSSRAGGSWVQRPVHYHIKEKSEGLFLSVGFYGPSKGLLVLK